MGELIEKLKQLNEENIYPFHMPGHKRNIDCQINPYEYDITEIEGFDNLHNPQDIFIRLNERIRKIYNTKAAFALVNGSTSGILSAISATVKPKETILLARNSHKAAYNAVFLRQINTEYIYPQNDLEMGISGAIFSNQVEKAFQKNPEIKAVFITSPTYEGVISNIEEISKIVHKYNAVLIVDAAHGAHFGLSEYFPINPLQQGADIVIMSIHKTLPAFTQTSVLCINGDRINCDEVKKYLDIYISSSPSYLLLSSIEKCMDIIETKGCELNNIYKENLIEFRKKCTQLHNLYLYEPKSKYDNCKLVICTNRSSIDGEELKKRLRKEYLIEVEMASKEYIIAMTSMLDTAEGFHRLFEALLEIDKTITSKNKKTECQFDILEKYSEIYEVDRYKTKKISILDAKNMVSAGYVYAYPPGIPWVTPGEIINSKLINRITEYRCTGLDIQGLTEQLEIDIIERN